MRAPVREIVGHLLWTRHGRVWAVWRLQPQPYGLRPVGAKHSVRATHQALLRVLPGESLLLSTVSPIDAGCVLERMVRGVDLDSHPAWEAECLDTLDVLDRTPLGERAFWLAVPLSDGSRLGPLRDGLRAGEADLREALALPYRRVPEAEVARRREQASQIALRLPEAFRARAATAGEVVWLSDHADRRGGQHDPPLPTSDAPTDDPSAQPHLAGVVLGSRVLDEGGQSDVPDGARRRLNPLRRRYLKVVALDPQAEPPASYQALLVLRSVPERMLFPGAEFLGRLDESGVAVDWAVRLVVRAGAEVTGRNRRASQTLTEQYDQRSDEVAIGARDIDLAADDLGAYVSRLAADDLEMEVRATVVLAVAAPDPGLLEARVALLTEYLTVGGFRFERPVGEQERLWWSMAPGVPASQVPVGWDQLTTTRDFSAAVPLAGTALGDDDGPLLGLNLSNGPASEHTDVVLHDLAAASRRDQSGSLAVVGELGSGKSVLLKKLAGAAMDRGGRIVAIDRTVTGEWASWAAAAATVTVVDAADPAWSLDPLRLFGPDTGGRVAQSFLTPLLDVRPTSDRGSLLSAVLEPGYLARHDLVGLGDLARHLVEGCELTGAAELARVMRVFASRDFGRVVFDPGLPVLPLDAQAVVVRTHDLDLPTSSDLGHRHLFAQMSLEKTMGRALYALLGTLARVVCFTRPDEVGVLVVDEAHHLTASPEGERAVLDFIRDGRKHSAAVLLGSHDPDDFGGETLRGLIPTRVVMRLTDRQLARRALGWLGLDADDPDLLELLQAGTSPVGSDGFVDLDRRGEAFVRDARGRIGRVRVLLPAVPERADAVLTTPGRADRSTVPVITDRPSLP